MQRIHFHSAFFLAASAVAFSLGCTPEERVYGSGGSGSTSGSGSGVGGGGGAGGMGGASSSVGTGASGGAGGATMCPPDTADCNMDGVCESNLLGDIDHCGACDNPCKAPEGGSASCVAGKCEIACGAGFGDCDQDPSTACLDLGSDPLNCGACGHDCLGGACSGGLCQPVIVLGPPPNIPTDAPKSIAVDGQWLYWGSVTGQIGYAAHDGKMPIAIGNVNGPAFDIAVTTNGVHAANGNRITTFDIAGGQKWGSTQDSGVQNLAATEVALAWTATGPGRVRKADPIGGNQNTLASLEMQPTSITIDGGNAYWTNMGGPGEIRKASLAGNAATTVFSGTPNPHHLISHAGVLYWVSGGQIFRGMEGAGSTALYSTPPDVRGMVTDGVFLYWTEAQLGQVYRAPVDASSGPVVVASQQMTPGDIALGPDSIYWISEDLGAIIRLAR